MVTGYIGICVDIIYDICNLWDLKSGIIGRKVIIGNFKVKCCVPLLRFSTISVIVDDRAIWSISASRCSTTTCFVPGMEEN